MRVFWQIKGMPSLSLAATRFKKSVEEARKPDSVLGTISLNVPICHIARPKADAPVSEPPEDIVKRFDSRIAAGRIARFILRQAQKKPERSQRVVSVALAICQFKLRSLGLSTSGHERLPVAPCGADLCLLLSGLSSPSKPHTMGQRGVVPSFLDKG